MNAYLVNKFENILAIGEIAYLEHFLLLSQCFRKSSAADASGLTLSLV